MSETRREREKRLEMGADGWPVGRDPREMTADELRALGHVALPVLAAIRAKCLDCCAGSAHEVRLCVALTCPSWPFRLGTNPWREKRVLSAAERAALRERLHPSA